MGLHDLFEYLKHKLWPKEGFGVKVSIWLLFTKNQESPWNTCVQVTCHIALESSQQGSQLCFKSYLNQRFSKEVMALQSAKSLNFKNFKTPNLEVLGQNDIWMLPSWLITKNTIKGKVVASPKSGSWWILWVHICPWLIRAPKLLQPCINQLVVWFVYVRMNNWPACHLS
jgi:hypothetical protein